MKYENLKFNINNINEYINIINIDSIDIYENTLKFYILFFNNIGINRDDGKYIQKRLFLFLIIFYTSFQSKIPIIKSLNVIKLLINNPIFPKNDKKSNKNQKLPKIHYINY